MNHVARRASPFLLCSILLYPVGSLGQQCPGDCNGDEVVAINELVGAVNIALDRATVASCAPVDTGFDGAVGISELIAATARAIDGCPESRFRFLRFEQASFDFPDRIEETFIEADLCQRTCANGQPEPFSSTLLGILIEASPGAVAQLQSVEIIYPGRSIQVLRDLARQPVFPAYCSNIVNFPCVNDDDCGLPGACVLGPTSVAFVALDLQRKELLGGIGCETGFDVVESPLLIRVRLADDGPDPIDLIAGTTLVADDFDRCGFR